MPLQTLGTTILASLSFLGTVSSQGGWNMATPAASPGALRFHEMAFDAARGRTVLFGGWQPYVTFSNTWEWDGSNWTAIATATAPAPRLMHAMAYHPTRARIVLFGGTDPMVGDYDDTWEYDGVDWQQLSPANHPVARRSARMAMDPHSGKLLLFGGGPFPSSLPEFGDTWEWDGTNWTQRQPAHSPPARSGHAMATDHARRTIVLFGGIATGQPTVGGDTWVWDGTDWSDATPASSPIARQQHSMSWSGQSQTVVMNGANNADVATWNWDGAEWRRDLRAPWFYLLSPYAMSYDSLRRRTVVFGEGVGPAGETWEDAPGALARWIPGSGGCQGTQGTPALQPAAGSLPILPSYFDLELRYGGGSAAALFVLGLERLPRDLSGVGMPGCLLRVSPDALVPAVQSSGTAVLSWILPNTTALSGVVVHAQGFVIDPGANAAGAVISDNGQIVLGRM